MDKKDESSAGSDQDVKEQRFTRREAIKRIALATALASASIAAAPLLFEKDGKAGAYDVYINYSKYSTYGSYADPVYLDYSSTGYYSIQYYTSHREKYNMPPLP